MEVGSVNYRLFNQVWLKDVLIEDFNQDTLLNAENISLSLLGYNHKLKQIKINRVVVRGGYINLASDSTGTMNLTEVINTIRREDSLKDDSKSSIGLIFNDISVVGSTFGLYRYGYESVDYGLDFNHLQVSNLNIDVLNFAISGDTIRMTINELTGTDRSGFAIENLRSDLTISSKGMQFERLRIKAMGSSITLPYLMFGYSDYDQLSDFLNTVSLNAQIQPSKVTTSFLSYFVPNLKGFNHEVSVEADVSGRISDLRIRNLSLSSLSNTIVQGDINLTGLPYFDETFILLNLNNLSTTTSDIASLKQPHSHKPLVEIPDEVMALGTISYRGSFTGFISDFVAYGRVTTDIGSVSLDATIRPDRQEGFTLKGSIAGNKLNMGTLLSNDMLGMLTFDAVIDGQLTAENMLTANTDVTISLLEANGYGYSNIKATGEVHDRTFEGTVFLDDPNFKLNFLGIVNLTDSVPVFDFSAFVPNIDLVALNLNTQDSISQASFLLAANFKGSTIDNSSGEIKVMNTMYRNQDGEVKTSDITITADNTVDSKSLKLSSEFADAEIRGKYNYANIGKSLTKLLYMYLPALSPDNEKPEITSTGVENPELNDYIVRLRLKKTRKFTDVLMPNLRIAENTSVFGIYNPDLQTLNLKVNIPEVVLSGNTIRNISIDGITQDTSFLVSVSIPHLDVGGTTVDNINLHANAVDNNISTSISWRNRHQIKNMGQINSTATFIHLDSLKHATTNISILESQFFLNDTMWNISPSVVTLNPNQIDFKDIYIHNDQQSLRVNGRISQQPSDSVSVELNNIDIATLNIYTQRMGYTLDGMINGQAIMTNFYDSPLINANLEINNITVNNRSVGNLSLNSHWVAEESRLYVSALNDLEGEQTFDLKGNIFPQTATLDMGLTINKFKVNHLEPIIKEFVTDITGSVSGRIRITGTTDKPVLNGVAHINGGGGTVEFTKTRYTVSDAIHLNNSNIEFRDFKLSDPINRLAVLNGTINTNHFSRIHLDLALAPSNFQFLNTTERDNEFFYGSVFASGRVRVLGAPNDLDVNATIRTEPRTVLYLPLAASGTVSEYNFVNFINHNPDIIIIEPEIELDDTDSPNLNLTLDLNVTPEAEVQLIIDKTMGDIIRANGQGNLRMEINPGADRFQMFGEYNIERGDYLLTLMGVINKRFRIDQGSSITWGGDIMDANVDINAIYTLRTTLNQLFPMEDNDLYKRRTNVNCYISLTEKLMEPDITFSIDVPDVDSDTRAKVENVLSTEEVINQQFLSLLVINSFMPPDQGMSQGMANQGMTNTASEFLSNQLTNMFSQLSDAVDIGINYRPGDASNELSSNELELALSTQLFNDRVTIHSNVDMGSQSNSGVAGDLNVDVKITESGKLRLKAFHRYNDEYLNTTTENTHTSGAGVVYREEFDSVGELLRRYWARLRQKEEEEEQTETTDEEIGFWLEDNNDETANTWDWDDPSSL